MLEKLGVDIGGVIIDRVNDQTDTSFFSDNYLRTTAVPGAIEALSRLNAIRFAGEVYLVSKCGPRIEAKTRAWLAHHGFHDITGITEGQFYFCRERRDKAPICRSLGITHFIDDRLDVLGHLTSVPHRFLFVPAWLEPGALPGPDDEGVVVVESWPQVLDLLL